MGAAKGGKKVLDMVMDELAKRADLGDEAAIQFKSTAERMADAKAMGFDTKLHHGGGDIKKSERTLWGSSEPSLFIGELGSPL